MTILSLREENDIANFFDKPNFYGMFFFNKAEGELKLDEQISVLENHSILFYYPYQKLKITGKVSGSFIQFHPDFFCIGIETNDIGCQGFLFNNFYNDILLKCTEEEFVNLSQLHFNFKTEIEEKRIGQFDMIASQLKILLINAVRIKTEKQDISYREEQHIRLEQLIEKYYLTESSPQFYADILGVSITEFNRCCQKFFKNNFKIVLNLKKIAAAKNELFLTNSSIKLIAYRNGFNDPLYFTRVFKKYCGLSSKQFRNQLKNNWIK